MTNKHPLEGRDDGPPNLKKTKESQPTISTTTIYTHQSSSESSLDELKQSSVLTDGVVNDSKLLTLSVAEFTTWSKEQTTSVLCAPEEQGGASLIDDAKLLYEAGFRGTVLGNIVDNINKYGEEKALSLLVGNKDFQQVSQSTLESVVNWVNNQLMPKLYHLWSADQVKKQLCKPIGEGGAGLSADQVKPFRDYGFSGKHIVQVYQKVISIEQLFKESGTVTMSCQLETTCKDVVRWIMKTLYTMDQPINSQLTVTPQTFIPTVDTITKFKSLVEIAKHYNFQNESFQVGIEYVDSEIKNFQNRSQFKVEANQFINMHVNTFKSNLNGPVSQQTFPFGILFNGSGCGKTRALREFKNILLEKHENVAFAYMSFGNGDQLTTTEMKIMSSQVTSTTISSGADLVIGFRLFCSFVPIPNNEREGLFYMNKHLFKFENVIKWVSTELKCTAVEKPLYLILAFDEYQKVFATAEHRTSLLHVVGTAGCNPNGVNEFNKKYGICLIPLIAGTISERDADNEFGVTGYGKKPFYLPPLQTRHCEQVFMDICSSQQNLITADGMIIDPQHLWKQQDFSIFYSQIAMIPKHSILFHNILLTYCSQFTNEKWNAFSIGNRIVEEIKNQVSESSILPTIPYDTSREFYDLILSANQIPPPGNFKLGEMVNDYLNRGLIYLSKNHSIYCNWTQLFSLLSKYNIRLNNTLSKFSYLTGNDDCKILGIYTLMSRMRDLLNSSRGISKFVYLSTLFPGINIQENVYIQLPKSAYLSEFQIETDYYLTIKKTSKTTEKTSKKKEKDRVSDSMEYDTSPINLYLKDGMEEPSPIYKSKINQKLVDGRWFTTNEEGKQVLILMKWKLRKKGTLQIDDVISLNDYYGLKLRYAEFEVFYILITTGSVSPPFIESREGKHKDYIDHVIWVDERAILNNFSPIIIPYLRFERHDGELVVTNESLPDTSKQQ